MNAIAFFLALLLLAGGDPQDRRGSRRGKGVPEGKEAPDFRLKKLLANERERTGEAEFVKLSDFKGEQPVVLIFGSYT
jgi:hypothetical protein